MTYMKSYTESIKIYDDNYMYEKEEKINDEELKTRKLLKSLTYSWEHRAQVKKVEFEEGEFLDDKKDDFLVSLLPFDNHYHFVESSPSMKKKILSCGWLAYNEKTLDIEAKIVKPACLHVVYGKIPGLQDAVSMQLASQTLVDEAYHILLVSKACQITKAKRDIHFGLLPESNLIKKMRELQGEYSEKWQKILIQLATAIVSEVFISDYLKLLSGEMSIHPFNRLIVDTHRRDELAHSSIFKNFAKCVYVAFGAKEREFFMRVLPKPVRWFANVELDIWHAMLQQIGFPHTDTVINDCKALNEESLARIDYSGVISLAEELGAGTAHPGMESFYREGLMG